MNIDMNNLLDRLIKVKNNYKRINKHLEKYQGSTVGLLDAALDTKEGDVIFCIMEYLLSKNKLKSEVLRTGVLHRMVKCDNKYSWSMILYLCKKCEKVLVNEDLVKYVIDTTNKIHKNPIQIICGIYFINKFRDKHSKNKLKFYNEFINLDNKDSGFYEPTKKGYCEAVNNIINCDEYKLANQ